MTDAERPQEPFTPKRASELFDEAVNIPARRDDAMGELFTGLGAAVAAMYEQKRALRKAMREYRAARPEAIARRKAAARKGWETRRARAAAEALAREIEEGPVRPYTGPTCDVMTHNSIGQETFCWLDQGHEESDHEDGLGCEWPREDWEDDEPGRSGPMPRSQPLGHPVMMRTGALTVLGVGVRAVVADRRRTDRIRRSSGNRRLRLLRDLRLHARHMLPVTLP